MKRLYTVAAALVLLAGSQLHAQAAQQGKKTDSATKKPAATAKSTVKKDTGATKASAKTATTTMKAAAPAKKDTTAGKKKQ